MRCDHRRLRLADYPVIRADFVISVEVKRKLGI
jgi:hypothetical protein